MAQQTNLSFDQGANVQIEITVYHANGSLLDLSEYTSESQFRKHFDSNTYFEFSTSGNANGILTLTMNAETTSNIAGGRYRYDVEITSPTNTTSRVQEGILTVNPQVTK